MPKKPPWAQVDRALASLPPVQKGTVETEAKARVARTLNFLTGWSKKTPEYMYRQAIKDLLFPESSSGKSEEW